MNNLPQKSAQAAARQARQARDEILSQVKKPPSEKADDFWEQVGWTGGQKKSDDSDNGDPQAVERKRLAELEHLDKEKSIKQMVALKEELEKEIERNRYQREEELKARRQEDQAVLSEEEMKKQKKDNAIAGMQTSKPKGMLAGVKSRLKKSRAELAGSRRSG